MIVANDKTIFTYLYSLAQISSQSIIVLLALLWLAHRLDLILAALGDFLFFLFCSTRQS